MLRLDYFLMRKGLLTLRDECTRADGTETTITSSNQAREWNQESKDDSDRFTFIKSFAFRDNKGFQPVLMSGFPILLLNSVGAEIKRLAGESNVDWSNDCEIKIKSWKPDIGKLLKQQNEYDKQQAIESKESRMSEFAYGQKVYIKDNTEHDFTFGCYHTDGESVLFLFDTGYGRADIDDVKATPFKTELDIAKEKQIDEVVKVLDKTKNMKFNRTFTQSMLKAMQDEGLLAEIILPLKDK